MRMGVASVLLVALAACGGGQQRAADIGTPTPAVDTAQVDESPPAAPTETVVATTPAAVDDPSSSCQETKGDVERLTEKVDDQGKVATKPAPEAPFDLTAGEVSVEGAELVARFTHSALPRPRTLSPLPDDFFTQHVRMPPDFSRPTHEVVVWALFVSGGQGQSALLTATLTSDGVETWARPLQADGVEPDQRSGKADVEGAELVARWPRDALPGTDTLSWGLDLTYIAGSRVYQDECDGQVSL